MTSGNTPWNGSTTSYTNPRNARPDWRDDMVVKVNRYTYRQVAEAPEGLRWDVPRRHQGQRVTVAYATPGTRYEQDEGAEWRRVSQASYPPRYYRLVADD